MSVAVKCPICTFTMALSDSALQADIITCSRCGAALGGSDNNFETVAISGLGPDEAQAALAKGDLENGGLSGRIIAGYRLVQMLGQGGMCSVYRAVRLADNAEVAFKVLYPHIVEKNPEYLRRFHQSARSAAKLEHENIVRVFADGSENNLHFFIMELVKGSTLQTLLDQRKCLAPAEAIAIIKQIVKALEEIWRHGLVHRDIKPANILIASDGAVKIADMDLAKDLTSAGNITQTGMVMGTLQYISPEQARDARKVDRRADIYSLGCVFYHMLCGRPPYEDVSLLAILNRHVQAPVPNPQRLRPELADDLCRVVMRMMAKRPADRYPDAAALLEDLHALEAGETLSWLSRSAPSAFRRRLLRGMGLAGKALLHTMASCVWYAMFMALGESYAGNSDIAAWVTVHLHREGWDWQHLLSLGGGIYLLANLIPIRPPGRAPNAVWQICGFVFLYIGAFLTGMAEYLLGLLLTSAGLLLRQRRRALADEIASMRGNGAD